MALIEDFFLSLDGRWKPAGREPITLQLIGSAALILQSDYFRGTNDGDILESHDIVPDIKQALLELAGRGSDIHRQTRLFLDFVPRGMPFLPARPVFHTLSQPPLKNFRVEVLDIHDVVLSKLARFNADDAGDIRAMVERDLLDHARLASRFQAAVDRYALDARAPDVPGYLKNLRTVERDLLGVPASHIQFPPEYGLE